MDANRIVGRAKGMLLTPRAEWPVAAAEPDTIGGLFSGYILVLAAIPVLWLVGRLLRWRGYTLALTTTRILVRRGVFDRDIVQIRLQRITEINLSQKLWERALSTGRLIVAVQGEDDAVVLEFVRKPAIVQRVVNGQINEICGGGSAEPIPPEPEPPLAAETPFEESPEATTEAEAPEEPSAPSAPSEAEEPSEST